MRAGPPSPARVRLAALTGCAAACALGLLPGAAGGGDPVTLLGWLALFAPAAGALCGGCAVALLPSMVVPAAWALLLLAAEARAERGLPTPLWAACAVGGLFACGHAFGRWSGAPARAAGLALLATLLLSGAAVGGGWLAGGAKIARSRPGAALRLLDVSPLVLVLDCAGWDWTHAHPEVYARAGVEWFPRRPWPGNLAGPVVLVVGCTLAVLSRRRGRPGADATPKRPWHCASTSARSPRS